MKLATIQTADTTTWGVVDDDDAFIDLGRHYPEVPDLRTAIASDILADLDISHLTPDLALANCQFAPLLANPPRIFCVGINYETHRVETARSEVGHPTIFLRIASSLTAHEGPFVRPTASEKLDYEGELAVVIGRNGRHITPEASWDHIAGCTCFNDGSVRDWQNHTTQFTPGKNFPQTGALGPWMATPDELDPIESISLVTRVNGVERQRATLAQMIFPIPDIIAYLSTFCELLPGDVIATGTPGGVGSRMNPPSWLSAGDHVEVDISSIGRLANTVVDEQPDT